MKKKMNHFKTNKIRTNNFCDYDYFIHKLFDLFE
jgi:hypothetical protein